MIIVSPTIRLSLILGLLAGMLFIAGCGSDDSTVIDEPGSFVLGSDNLHAFENAVSLVVTIERINGESGEVTVDYATQNGTALAGADYLAISGTLTFADGEVSQTVTIQFIDNADTDGIKNFQVLLSNPTGEALLGIPSEAVVTILDDEETPIYDFENLLEGEINGQDSWIEFESNALVERDTSPANGTLVVRPNTTVLGDAGDTEISRVNDTNFDYAPFISNEGEIWFDTTADDNSIFALGQDINGDGFLKETDGEIGVAFGIWERRFTVFQGSSLIVKAGTADLGEGNEATDWYRLRLKIDFAANLDDGAASLAYMNLSNGEIGFTDIDELQDLNLKLIFNRTTEESEWNAMFLLLRIDATNIPKADNLIPNVLGN